MATPLRRPQCARAFRETYGLTTLPRPFHSGPTGATWRIIEPGACCGSNATLKHDAYRLDRQSSPLRSLGAKAGKAARTRSVPGGRLFVRRVSVACPLSAIRYLRCIQARRKAGIMHSLRCVAVGLAIILYVALDMIYRGWVEVWPHVAPAVAAMV